MSIRTQLRQSTQYLLKRLSGEMVGFADPNTLAKAERFVERYREIVSDPLNILIERVPRAGYVDSDGYVFLHNGNRADLTGKFAYYAEFSDILVINRGVHEPLEEFCFQQLLKCIARPEPLMIELGAYWAHYSMWMKRSFPMAKCIMVEPDPHNSECGRNNFAANGYEGEFIVDFVGAENFAVDRFLADSETAHVDLLHCDIQGFELEMLDGASRALTDKVVDYVFVSTHSEQLHSGVVERLRGHGYRIEVSSDFEEHTTSNDGFVLASSHAVIPVFDNLQPLGRLEIAHASPGELIRTVTQIEASLSVNRRGILTPDRRPTLTPP
ncbi:hypothetical protein GCM10009087_41300 [Sphingomonas oligophenolica]|uniref:FkbM family methyltransferase n=1 Tax=Sphingomonas oligophenolica TaxID=301154 RepID=A0ABU9YCP4_9SPHN